MQIFSEKNVEKVKELMNVREKRHKKIRQDMADGCV